MCVIRINIICRLVLYFNSVLFLAAAAGCRPSLPTVKDVIFEATQTNTFPEIIGPHGPLPHGEAKAVITELEQKAWWSDTDVRIEGPAVAEFQRLFLDTWIRKKGPALSRRRYFPTLEKAGDNLVRVVGSTPGENNRVTYMMYAGAISFAENSVHITAAYFVPDQEVVKALTMAAARGVDVKLILPSVSDHSLVFSAGRSYYTQLLKAGVKLFERRGRMLHAKTAVIDGVWSTVGSTNMDLWSFLRNDEVNAVILGRSFAAQMEAMFAGDLEKSNPITLEQWKKRPLIDHMAEWFGRLFGYWF